MPMKQVRVAWLAVRDRLVDVLVSARFPGRIGGRVPRRFTLPDTAPLIAAT
jgi:hypothetical protein